MEPQDRDTAFDTRRRLKDNLREMLAGISWLSISSSDNEPFEFRVNENLITN
jgi:hypothetical protein